MEQDCTLGACAGFGKYTHEVAYRRRNNPQCGSQGVDDDGHCTRCGLRPDGCSHCPPGFLVAEQLPSLASTTPAAAPERIVAAALRHAGVVFSIAPPARHHTVIRLMMGLGLDMEAAHVDNQGFLTSHGRFVDREEGARIARAANQLIREPTPWYMLTSEDVW